MSGWNTEVCQTCHCCCKTRVDKPTLERLFYQMEADLKKSNEEREKHLKRAIDLESYYQKKEWMHETLQKNLKERDHELWASEAEVRKLQKKVKELEEEVDHLEHSYNASEEAVRDLRKEVKELEDQLAEATKCLCDMLYVCPNHRKK